MLRPLSSSLLGPLFASCDRAKDSDKLIRRAAIATKEELGWEHEDQTRDEHLLHIDRTLADLGSKERVIDRWAARRRRMARCCLFVLGPRSPLFALTPFRAHPLSRSPPVSLARQRAKHVANDKGQSGAASHRRAHQRTPAHSTVPSITFTADVSSGRDARGLEDCTD